MKKYIIAVSYGSWTKKSEFKVTNAANKKEARKKALKYINEQRAIYSTLYAEATFTVEELTESKLAAIQAGYDKINAEYDRIYSIRHSLLEIIWANNDNDNFGTL